MKLTRPLLRWHGGKWRLAPWIIQHLPPHRIYVEPYGGAASVLLRKERAKAEIYNDLDEALVNIMRVLRDEAASARLVRMLRFTPYSRREQMDAYRPTRDPVEKARRTIVRSFMGFGSDGTAGVYPTGFRALRSTCGTTPASEWAGYPDALAAIIERLQGVTIEQRPAIDVMREYDEDGALHFLDPPYLAETRSSGNRRRGKGFHVYQHELENEDHTELLAVAREMRGMVVICGYPSPMYQEALPEWTYVTRAARADGNRPRTECIWISPRAAERLHHLQLAMGFHD